MPRRVGTNRAKNFWGKKRWGQSCLVIAVALNSVAIVSDVKLNTLQDEHQELFEKEQYFIGNIESVYGVVENLQNSHRQLNMHQTIRRIGSKVDALTESEERQLAQDEHLFAKQISSSLQAAVTAKYLLSNDPSMDVDLDSMFSAYSDDELLALIPQFEAAAFVEAKRDKLKMNSLKDSISRLKSIHSALLLLVTTMIIFGSALLFAAGETPEVGA